MSVVRDECQRGDVTNQNTSIVSHPGLVAVRDSDVSDKLQGMVYLVQ